LAFRFAYERSSISVVNLSLLANPPAQCCTNHLSFHLAATTTRNSSFNHMLAFNLSSWCEFEVSPALSHQFTEGIDAFCSSSELASLLGLIRPCSSFLYHIQGPSETETERLLSSNMSHPTTLCLGIVFA
jgi:hypothetical protein